jgi:hypothetical protein
VSVSLSVSAVDVDGGGGVDGGGVIGICVGAALQLDC